MSVNDRGKNKNRPWANDPARRKLRRSAPGASRTALTCLFLGGALVICGFAIVADYDSAYRVKFGKFADGCSGSELNLDSDTGERLQCVYMAGGRPVDNEYSFSPMEEQRIVELSTKLGSDGLSSKDKSDIEHLVDEIAAADGNPDPNDPTGPIFILSGLSLVAIGAFWAIGSATKPSAVTARPTRR